MAKGNDGLVIGLLLAGGAVAALLWAQRGAADAGSNGPADVLGVMGGGEGSGLPIDRVLYVDPATGHILNPDGSPGAGPGGADATTTPASGPATVTISLSPEAEKDWLKQNEDANKQIVASTDAANQQVTAEARRQSRLQGWEAGAVIAGTTLAVGKPVLNAISRTPGLLRATPTLARTAGPVGAGVALGLSGVAVLNKTGALDQVQKFGSSTIGKAPTIVQSAVKTAVLGPSLVGAVATAAVGRGSVQENVRKAIRGTPVGGLFGAR